MNLKIEDTETWLIKPLPGYVCKWKDVKIGGIAGEETRKCFVNVCHCEQLPPPIDDLDQEEIAEQLDGGQTSYRIPMSVGEIDCTKDRKDENSVKIDVLVNSGFYQKRLSSAEDTFFRHLLALIFCDLIKEKHAIDLDPMKAIILKNRASVGDLEVQRVHRRPEKQIVEEMVKEDMERQKKWEEAREKERPDEDETVEEVKKAMFGMRTIEGVKMRLFDGKRLEISMRCEINGNVIKDPRRLQLKMKPTRCLVVLEKRQSLFDFGLPFTIDLSTIKSKYNDEKFVLVLSAEISVPR